MKVLIADDHWISRAGLSHLLGIVAPEGEVVEATTFDEACAQLSAGGFDICIVDPSIASVDPFVALKGLRETAPDVPLIVITAQPSRRMALQAIECGAHGFIGKSASADEIRRSIERVLAGEIALPANFLELPPGSVQPRGEAPSPFAVTDGDSPLALLTQRQRDVLALIATGKRNAEIGALLNISPRTVQIHVSTILKLLGVGNRTEAALLARRYGMGNP